MPLRVLRTLLERHGADGDWVVVRADEQRVSVEAGGTGNRLDPGRRVRRAAWELRRIDGDLEVLATWPVPELVTHRIGEQVAQLHDDVARAGGDPAADLATVAAGLPEPLCPERVEGRPLAAVLWSAAYPLLRTPIERGALLDHVPVALDGVLRAVDARRGARRAYGRVTRPLVRALATSLLPGADGRVPVEPAVLALMAGPWCGPEQLTDILATAPHRPGAVAFDVGDVDRARAMFHGVPSRRVTARLRAALVEPDGLRGLARDLAAWEPPPDEDLETLTQRPRPALPVPPRPASPPRPMPPTHTPLAHPAHLRAVEGVVIAGRTVVLPRTADELMEWGMVLDNCLGGFRHAVAGGRTHVLGLTERGSLRYAVEVTRTGVVRQFEGARNRQAPHSVTAPVLAALSAHGVVRADGRRGTSLLAPP